MDWCRGWDKIVEFPVFSHFYFFPKRIKKNLVRAMPVRICRWLFFSWFGQNYKIHLHYVTMYRPGCTALASKNFVNLTSTMARPRAAAREWSYTIRSMQHFKKPNANQKWSRKILLLRRSGHLVLLFLSSFLKHPDLKRIKAVNKLEKPVYS